MWIKIGGGGGSVEVGGGKEGEVWRKEEKGRGRCGGRRRRGGGDGEVGGGKVGGRAVTNMQHLITAMS